MEVIVEFKAKTHYKNKFERSARVIIKGNNESEILIKIEKIMYRRYPLSKGWIYQGFKCIFN